MRASVTTLPWRRRAGLGVLSALLVLVVGCGDGGRDFTRVVMGPTAEENIEMEGERPPETAGPRCPAISVRDGTESLRVYQRGHEGDPRNLVYQGVVSTVARECHFVGNNSVRIKFGVSGRLITGPAGGPGNFQLPVRVAAVRAGGEPVWSNLYQVPVTVEPGQSSARFSHVAEDVTFDIPVGDYFGLYVVFVGFDAMS